MKQFSAVVISLAFAPHVFAAPLISTRLPHKVKNFYRLHKDKVPYCFVEKEDRLEFFLRACDQTEGRSPQQSFWLSDRPKTRLSSDIAGLKAEILKSGAASETQIADLEALAKRDTFGRIIYTEVAGVKLPIGWISHELELDGKESDAQVLDLCSGAWGEVCSYNHDSRRFEVSFADSKRDPESGDVKEMPRRPILRVLYAGVFSRGNDDFVAHHYYNVSGAGEESGKSFPVSQEWKDALEAKLAGRIDPTRRQMQTPRSEPNYLTGLHPVYVVEIENAEGKRETKLTFAAAVVYMKNSPAMECCEDDTGSYELVDFALFENLLSRPYSGRAIEKLDLSAIRTNRKTIRSLYGEWISDEEFDSDTLPKETVSSHYDLFNIGTSVTIDGTKDFQTQIVMKVDDQSANMAEKYKKYASLERSNAVREYIEIRKPESGLWKVNVTAFNPNDPKNSNSVPQGGRFYINPATISEVWTAEKGITGESQPFQRAVAMQLKSFEKKSKEGIESRDWTAMVAGQRSKHLYDNFQTWTTHSQRGLIGYYVDAFQYFYAYGGNENVKNNPMRSIVPRVLLENMWTSASELDKAEYQLTDPMVVEIYTGDRIERHAATVDEALTRIAQASNPAAQIKLEVERSELIANQSSLVSHFFAIFAELARDTAALNTLIVQARKLPLKKRPTSYLKARYNDAGEKIGEDRVPFPKRLTTLILGEGQIVLKPFFDGIEADLLLLKKLSSAPKVEQVAAARSMYEKIFSEQAFVDLRSQLEGALRAE